jgi:hypothetical protein
LLARSIEPLRCAPARFYAFMHFTHSALAARKLILRYESGRIVKSK